MKEINKYIDHTLLKPTATRQDILSLCKEASDYNFFSVCVNSYWVTCAVNALKNTNVKICATVGFPLGANSTKAKVEEAKKAVADGASEIDMVMNIGLFKSQLTKEVRADISAVKKAIGNTILKVIIETCYLNKSEIKLACEICEIAGADFIKTSTGFGNDGAQLKDIQIIKSAIGKHNKIKASGGIANIEQAVAFIHAGANRIGTSKGVEIIYSAKEKEL
ncbi:deoxyribose-phosphate aldolase [Lacinutrix sp. MedPE-SW]|uniref:deoxyribose-phosphate aldolase n=1 Tax=Lacinutrix sp. MedPE-SW TaxID=1860087 RepID=UPI00091557FD|nr:deoxyribose-phosphate aldolase [Lacinutrix sp. MedPE-SW]OIQ18749.1 MAG: deoxyribose-phosphate aldolase [Lacinutrix sp. MedPE-SW]